MRAMLSTIHTCVKWPERKGGRVEQIWSSSLARAKLALAHASEVGIPAVDAARAASGVVPPAATEPATGGGGERPRAERTTPRGRRAPRRGRSAARRPRD